MYKILWRSDKCKGNIEQNKTRNKSNAWKITGKEEIVGLM
jgi:hypothetical protein